MNHRHPRSLRVASLARLATVLLARLPARLPALLLALLLALPLLTSLPSSAGNLQVAPILLEFANSQPSQTLWLTNSGTEALRAQVRVQHWAQQDGQEHQQPSDGLLASPPLMDIGPGQSQLVRIVQPQPGRHADEQAFRLTIDEVPTATGSASSSLRFLLRYSIPVFVLPTGATPQLERTGKRLHTDATQLQGHWQASNGQARLVLHNHGVQRIRISQLSWIPTSGPAIEITPGLLGYVLAGQQMRWTLPLPGPLPADGFLHARLNDDVDPQALPQVAAEH